MWNQCLCPTFGLFAGKDPLLGLFQKFILIFQGLIVLGKAFLESPDRSFYSPLWLSVWINNKSGRILEKSELFGGLGEWDSWEGTRNIIWTQLKNNCWSVCDDSQGAILGIWYFLKAFWRKVLLNPCWIQSFLSPVILCSHWFTNVHESKSLLGARWVLVNRHLRLEQW